MHWTIKPDSDGFIGAELLKDDLKEFNLFDDVHLEQNTDTGGRITAVRMYIRGDRNQERIRQNITQAISLFTGCGYKIEKIE